MAPWRRESAAGRRSGTGPAPTAAPFVIAAVLVPRAVGFGGAVTGRREWNKRQEWLQQIALGFRPLGLERSPRMSYRRRRRSSCPHAKASHLK